MGAIKLNMAPTERKAYPMFNNSFDQSVMQKLSALLNSPKGNELKQNLNSINKDDLYNTFLKLNVSQEDINAAAKKINSLSNEEIISIISRIRGE